LIIARYGFWDADQDDDAAFDRRLSAVLREVGDRGKLMLSEAVPPSFREPTPAPAPAPASTREPVRAPAPAPGPVQAPALAQSTALAPAPTALATLTSPVTPRIDAPQQTYTPSMQQHDSMPLSTLSTERQGGGTVAAGVSLTEVSTFMTEQLKAVARMEARMDKQASEAKAEMEAQRLENDRLRAEAAETRVETVVREIASAKSCVSEGQLEMLQTRLDALHEAKLLTDDEVGALEDCVADYIDCCSSLNPAAAEIGAAAEKVKKMVGLSEGMGKDRMLARQLRRKFAVGQ
jgi:hypothetical protein